MRLLPLALIPLALASAGCSDELPPPPAGGYQARITDSSETCNKRNHGGQVAGVEATQVRNVATDGVNGASISCAVTGSGPFRVTGSAFQGTNALSISIPSIGPDATAENPAKGTVSIATVESAGEAFQSPPNGCNFYFLEGGQTVRSGFIWVSFDCPEIILDGTETCGLTSGYASFQNCETEADD